MAKNGNIAVVCTGNMVQWQVYCILLGITNPMSTLKTRLNTKSVSRFTYTNTKLHKNPYIFCIKVLLCIYIESFSNFYIFLDFNTTFVRFFVQNCIIILVGCTCIQYFIKTNVAQIIIFIIINVFISKISWQSKVNFKPKIFGKLWVQ